MMEVETLRDRVGELPTEPGVYQFQAGETVLYDSEADGAWIRADCAVEVER